MSLISAGSISLDSVFKASLLRHAKPENRNLGCFSCWWKEMKLTFCTFVHHRPVQKWLSVWSDSEKGRYSFSHNCTHWKIKRGDNLWRRLPTIPWTMQENARACLWIHCNENPIYVFPEKELRGLSLNSTHIYVCVSDLYFPRIGPHIFLRQQTDRGNM